jgi:hypothetical protein
MKKNLIRKQPTSTILTPMTLDRLDKYCEKTSIPRTKIIEEGINLAIDRREGKKYG